jgi:lysophospholipase L1-like esterase
MDRNGVPIPMRLASKIRAAGPWLAVTLLFVSAGTAGADPMQTYLALGDAIAFGQSGTLQPSYGNQGYVSQFASYLATQNNGVTPNVINLALSGETSSTYFSGDNPSGSSRGAGAQANLNYGGDTTLSQRSFLAGVSAAERAAGRTITTVTFALGLGDYQSTVNAPGFSQLTTAQQQAAVQQMLTNLQANYTTALTQIRGVLPNAQLYLPSYYNPYPTNSLFTTFVVGQEQLIQSLAPQFNARVVNLTSSLSSPADFTTGPDGFSYPSTTGYSLIANQIISVAEAPEPGSLTLLAFGVVGLAGRGFWRRRAA